MLVKYRLYVFLLLAALTLVSCNVPDDVSQAQQTVALADSLRVRQSASADNLSAPDSAVLAFAYHTLAKNAFRRWHYADDYTRACYHYGRQLRQSGNQVAAMQCFIDGTHSLSRDYAVKARLYANMANMCRFEGNHDFAYLLYRQSAECFLKAGQTTNYYYALNNMAFENAEQNKTDDALSLLRKIDSECRDSAVLVKNLETYAILYNKIAKYDSTIYFVDKLQSFGYAESTGLLNKAQAFYSLGLNDSAVYYAHQVETNSSSLEDLYNCLYILAYKDEHISEDEMRAITSRRAEIGIMLQKQQGKLSHSVETLQHYRKSHNIRVILYVLLIIVLFVSLIVYYCIYRRNNTILMNQKKERALLQETTQIEQAKQTQLLKLQQELISSNDELLQQSAQLKQQQSVYMQSSKSIIEQNCRKILKSSDWKRELHWKDYNRFCEITNQLFFFLTDKLKAKKRLNETDIRLCILVLLDSFDLKKMAFELNYSESGIAKLKYRVAQKLNTNSSDLRQYLIDLAISYDISDTEK